MFYLLHVKYCMSCFLTQCEKLQKKYQFRVDSKDVDIAQYIHIAHGTILECSSAQVCSLPAPCRIWHLHTGDILLQKLATPGNTNRT